jgi:NAD(P)-dependent dehydrogenase (short-subunit alcohol dehydrogenase family)
MAYNPFSLEEKRVLVTGASSGIGKAVAQECARCGAELILTARNEERLKATLDSLEGEGHSMMIADLTNQDELAALVGQMEPMDGVVLCAGINDKSIIKFLNQEHVDKMLATNFTSPVYLSQMLTKKKKLNKEASVVFISSISAFYPSVSNAMYASSKAALSQFAKVLALELMPQKIRVNCIEPAFVETGMLNKYEISDKMDEIRANAPFGRFLESVEVAQAVIYLLSDATKLMTGSSIVLDGGFLIKR